MNLEKSRDCYAVENVELMMSETSDMYHTLNIIGMFLSSLIPIANHNQIYFMNLIGISTKKKRDDEVLNLV
jgi:hypothetical protein